MIDLHSLIYFKKVAELQHLTRAAEELRVAQPSLSRTIAGLEAELGVKLFDRVGKGIVRLTAYQQRPSGTGRCPSGTGGSGGGGKPDGDHLPFCRQQAPPSADLRL